jgi:hypothetical protein
MPFSLTEGSKLIETGFLIVGMISNKSGLFATKSLLFFLDLRKKPEFDINKRFLLFFLQYFNLLKRLFL